MAIPARQNSEISFLLDDMFFWFLYCFALYHVFLVIFKIITLINTKNEVNWNAKKLKYF